MDVVLRPASHDRFASFCSFQSCRIFWMSELSQKN